MTPLFTESCAPKLVRRADGRRHRVLDVTIIMKLAAADTGGTLSLFENAVPPGKGVPPHLHHFEDEVFHVLEGAAEFQIGDRVFTAVPGSVVFAPRGVAHSFLGRGPVGARMRVTVTPGGIEELFARLEQLPGHGLGDLNEVMRIAAEHGIEFAGPTAPAA